jgi:hypothetical protein
VSYGLDSGDVREAEDPFTILLVAVNNAHAMLIMRAFERLGFTGRIEWLRDGKAALDYLRLHEGGGRNLPRMVLLDLRLPKVDGHEVLSQIKSSERLRAIPVVVLTTSTSDDDLRQAYSNHVNSYLIKPLSFEDLKRTVEEIKEYWLGWNRSPRPA